MFHPGRVLMVFENDSKQVFGHDKSAQVLVHMWDENLLVVGVETGLNSHVHENDVVLVDYSPVSPNLPMPRQMVVKVIRGEPAKKLWKHFEENQKKRKLETEDHQLTPNHNIR